MLATKPYYINASKTQFIWLGGGRRLAGVDRSSVAIAFPHICFQDSVRDLGVILDQELSFSLHINQLTRSCYYQLRQLQVVSRSLSCSAAAALVHAFLTSRLDHCSSTLADLPLAQTARLARVLRCAARLIGRIPKYGSVSAYMRDTLHWLPIAQRISYRMAVLVYGGAFLVVPPVTFVSSVDRYLVYLDAEPFVPLLLASYWCLALKLQLSSVAHSPLLVLHLKWTPLGNPYPA